MYFSQQPNRAGQPFQDSHKLASLAEQALQAFRDENPDAFKELSQAFEGRSADLVLLGHGRFNVAVQEGEVRIEPDVLRGKGSTGHGAAAPEALLAIMEGRLTPLEAFFKGDLIARADSADLHQVYNYFVRYADIALRSERLQEVASRFRELVNLPPNQSQSPGIPPGKADDSGQQKPSRRRRL